MLHSSMDETTAVTEPAGPAGGSTGPPATSSPTAERNAGEQTRMVSTNAEANGAMQRRRFLAVAGGALLAGPALSTTAQVAAADPYEGWFDDVDSYEGTVDYRGRETVAVTVGAGNGLSFDPPAVLVDPGTTIRWEWTGEGGEHNVHATDGPIPLDSDLEDTAGFEYEFTVESDHEGITRYVCVPHEAVHMKGAVAVGDDIVSEADLVEPEPAAPTDGGGDGETGPWLPTDPLDLATVTLGALMGGGLLILPAFLGFGDRRS